MSERFVDFTVSFSEKEYRILKILAAANDERMEDYIHETMMGCLSSDIDVTFGSGTDNEIFKKLHKMNDELRSEEASEAPNQG